MWLNSRRAHTHTHTYTQNCWLLVVFRLLKFWSCVCITTVHIGCEYWDWYRVDMSSNITCLKITKVYCIILAVVISLFAVLPFLHTSVSECVYRCCAALITFYPLYSRTSSVKPRGGKSNYILLALSANNETGFLYLWFCKSISIIKWAKCT